MASGSDAKTVGGTSAVPITLSAVPSSDDAAAGGTSSPAPAAAPAPAGKLSVEDDASQQISRTRSGGLQTTDGTLYVSKPFRTSGSKRSRAIISFVPRNSKFDPQGTAPPHEFQGFFTLFWISMFLLVVQNYVSSYEKSGYPIELAFAAMFSRHALALALSDAALAISTGFCVLFAKALQKNWLNYYGAGIAIQHTFQTFILFTAVTWTFNRQWPWVQSGFFTLHSLVMIMKMHSYMATNGYLQKVNREYEKVYASLRSAASAAGGWETVLVEAQAHAPPSPSSTPSEPSLSTGGGTPQLEPGQNGNQRSYIDGDMAIALRKRLDATTATARNTSTEVNGAASGSDATEAQQREQPEYAVLVHHPDEHVARLAQELLDLNVELTGPLGKMRWPNNISWTGFADYMLIPTLVYELEYPRTERIRPFYVFEKTVATFGTFALLYTITENFILPLVPTKEQSFLRSLLDLSLPFMVAYLLLFYIIFECICNGFAELSRFADREFYEDWWNSASWDEFARKWNKPVHAFLLRHVYASTLSSGRFSKKSAMTLTFFLSACVHELVMAVVTKKIRMYLFFLQLIQIPLIAIGRLPIIKRNKVMGNVVFWLGLYAGFPLLCVAYCAY